MQNQSPISRFESRFTEIGMDFEFVEDSVVSASLTPTEKSKVSFSFIDLELDIVTPTLHITSPLPYTGNNNVHEFKKLLAVNDKIKGSLSLHELESGSYILVHSLDIPTDENYKISPARFHMVFSKYARDFYTLCDKLSKDEDEPSAHRDQNNEDEDVSTNNEPVGFKP
ncbi:MAG: hypothetical protein ABEK17_01235 [Candidatus Aenigmatarchaeota archaeon]